MEGRGRAAAASASLNDASSGSPLAATDGGVGGLLSQLAGNQFFTAVRAICLLTYIARYEETKAYTCKHGLCFFSRDSAWLVSAQFWPCRGECCNIARRS